MARRILFQLSVLFLGMFLSVGCGSSGKTTTTTQPKPNKTPNLVTADTPPDKTQQPPPVKETQPAADAWKKVFDSIEFKGASVTSSLVDGKPTGLPKLADRFVDQINKAAGKLQILDNYKPFKLFVGVDYFYPSGQGYLELLDKKKNDEQVKQGIEARLKDLFKNVRADQYYIGLGPESLYVLGPKTDTLDFGNNLPTEELTSKRYRILKSTLEALAKTDAYKEKLILIRFDEYGSIVTGLKSMATEGQVYPITDAIGAQAHPNALGQALIVNYVIDQINKHNKEEKFEIPFMPEKAPVPFYLKAAAPAAKPAQRS